MKIYPENIILAIILILGAESIFVPSAQARRLRVANNPYSELFSRDYAIQEQLLKKGLFDNSLRVEGREVRFSFVKNPSELAESVARLLIKSEERLAKNGDISAAEIIRNNLRRDNPQRFKEYVQEIQDRLAKNPWSIIAKDAQGEIVGVVLSGLFWTDTENDLPDRWEKTTWANKERAVEKGQVNTYVDFWFTGENGKFAVAMLYASALTAQAINALADRDFYIDFTPGKEKFYAYSNPRSLWKYQKPNKEQETPELLAEKYYELLLENQKDPRKGLYDRAISAHLRNGAHKVRIIEEAFDFFSEIGSDGIERKGAIGNRHAFIMRYSLSALKSLEKVIRGN